MQQTEKYKLNLIEKNDTFSPDPMNENMEKVEGALETKADFAAINVRVRELEVHKFIVGKTTQGGTENLGATPKALLISGSYVSLIMGSYTNGYVRLVDGGFYHTGDFSSCFYIAFF